MERNHKIEHIQNLKSESEIHDLLLDLLPYMKYDDVSLTHERGNNPELGKDIVASVFDEIENKKEWTAFVIKKGDIRGTSVGTQEIKAQIEECFEFPWNSLPKGKGIKISKVKVVTNGKYNAGAVSKIVQDHFYNNPNISLWSCTELIEFIDKFYPRFWLKGSKIYKKYIEVFQAKNKEDDLTKSLGISNDKIKKLIEFVIKPKLLESFINDEGNMKRKWHDSHEVARINECSLIVGESGSGKSTFFKQLASDIIYENSRRNDYEYYPFILTFSELEKCNYNVELLIQRHLESEDLKEISIDSKELFFKKNFLLFIDALDELGSQDLKEKALKGVQEFRDKFPEIKIYCSSRPTDSLLANCLKLKFKYLEISNVSLQEAEQFIGRYYNDEEIKCKRLLRSLRDSGILEKLPKTPLTLTLLTAIFDENEVEIPGTISDLYKNFVELLLNKSFKGSTVDLLQVGIHRSVLSFLAEYLHTNKKRNITKSLLIEILKEFALERGHKYDINTLISDLINRIGLLIANDHNEIEFKHLSFQEYFTAYQFYNHKINGKKYFIDNFNDPWWQNVAIFYAGMTKDSPELIEEILNKSKPTNFQEYLINLSGIGLLLQALYNTPISSRMKGIIRNLDNARGALDFISKTTDPAYDIIKLFFNTNYGAHKIISYWFEFHHNSITLKEPLEQGFKILIEKLKSEQILPEEKLISEYSAYLLASTLSDIDDYNFNYLKELLLILDSKNYYVLGLIDSNFTQHLKSLTKEERRRKDLRKFGQRLDFIDRDKVTDNVNIRLIDGKKVKRKPKR